MAASDPLAGSSAIGSASTVELGGKEPAQSRGPDPEPTGGLPPRDPSRGKVRLDPTPPSGEAGSGRDRRPANLLTLSGCVAHPFSYPVGDQLSLHLGDRGEDGEDQAPRCRRRVELGLGEAGKADPGMLQVPERREGVQRAPEGPVELPDQDLVDPPPAYVAEKTSPGRPVG